MDTAYHDLKPLVIPEPLQRDWLGASLDERLQHIRDAVFFGHPKLIKVMQTLAARIECRVHRGGSKGMHITAPSGGGKSRLIKHLAQLWPPYDRVDGTSVPFVHINVPNDCSLGNVCSQILCAMGDPVPLSGTTAERRRRCEALIKSCNVCVLAVDNTQDIPQRRGVKGVESIGNFFRDIVDLDVIVMLLGTPEAAVVVKTNPQLKRRAFGHLRLGPYSIDTPQGMGQTLRMIAEFERRLPLAELPNHACTSVGKAIAVASDGNLSNLANLYCEAIIAAWKENRETITEMDLSKAFELLYLDEASNNPFKEGFGKWRRLSGNNEPHEVQSNPRAYR